VLITKVSSQDIAIFSDRLNELDGVKSLKVLKNSKAGSVKMEGSSKGPKSDM
jgi:hypothetical protein